MSVVDFLIYCEMFQIKSLYHKEVPNMLPNLSTWYDLMEKEECFKQVNMELKKVIDIHNLHDPEATNI